MYYVQFFKEKNTGNLVSILGSDQNKKLDGRKNLENLKKQVKSIVKKLDNPYIDAYEIRKGTLKDYSVLFKKEQVLSTKQQVYVNDLCNLINTLISNKKDQNLENLKDAYGLLPACPYKYTAKSWEKSNFSIKDILNNFLDRDSILTGDEIQQIEILKDKIRNFRKNFIDAKAQVISIIECIRKGHLYINRYQLYKNINEQTIAKQNYLTSEETKELRHYIETEYNRAILKNYHTKKCDNCGKITIESTYNLNYGLCNICVKNMERDI
ncbi:MAG: hypothetical protein K9K32_00060 [Halanaerobiales bacterium]|nr:hypothetical protein [Halanaerobiales bacterium]